MDDINSFDDQYFTAEDLFRLLEALDYYINRPEGMWEKVDSIERERWGPYRRLRARLQVGLGMRAWDDADKWLDKQLLFERMAVVQAFSRRMEEMLKDERLTRSLLRDAVRRTADELDRTRFTQRPPRAEEVDVGMAIRDRTKMPFRPDNWRRRTADYAAMNREDEEKR